MSVSKPFEESSLQNVTQLVKNSGINSQSLLGDGLRRPVPVLPPRPNYSSGLSNSNLSYGGGNFFYFTKRIFVYLKEHIVILADFFSTYNSEIQKMKYHFKVLIFL